MRTAAATRAGQAAVRGASFSIAIAIASFDPDALPCRYFSWFLLHGLVFIPAGRRLLDVDPDSGFDGFEVDEAFVCARCPRTHSLPSLGTTSGWTSA